MTDRAEPNCGLEGADGDPVQVGRFNRWLAMGMRHHLIPMKQELSQVHASLADHIRADEIMQAQILGGIKVLTWLTPILAILVPGLIGLIIYMMFKAGMI
jgi:hypothetical protein